MTGRRLGGTEAFVSPQPAEGKLSVPCTTSSSERRPWCLALPCAGVGRGRTGCSATSRACDSQHTMLGCLHSQLAGAGPAGSYVTLAWGGSLEARCIGGKVGHSRRSTPLSHNVGETSLRPWLPQTVVKVLFGPWPTADLAYRTDRTDSHLEDYLQSLCPRATGDMFSSPPYSSSALRPVARVGM